MKIKLTFWGNALKPKSETFNFPYESSKRFSGYKTQGNKLVLRGHNSRQEMEAYQSQISTGTNYLCKNK